MFPEGSVWYRMAVKLQTYERTLSMSTNIESLWIRCLLQDSRIIGMNITQKLVANHSHQASALLAIYRLLDVQLLLRDCTAKPYSLQSSCPQISLLRSQPTTVQKLWKKLDNWQQLIINFKNCFNRASSKDEENIPAELAPTFRNTLSHLKGLAISFSDEQLDNIAKNFRVAALHWSFLQEVSPSDEQNLPSLPETIESIVNRPTLDQMLSQFSKTTSEKIKLFLSSHNHGKLSYPLHLSLLLTPLFLLMPVNLAGSNFHRESVNLLSIAIGNQKPAILTLIESEIWMALSIMATAECNRGTTHRAFQRLLGSEPFLKAFDMSPTNDDFSFFKFDRQLTNAPPAAHPAAVNSFGNVQMIDNHYGAQSDITDDMHAETNREAGGGSELGGIQDEFANCPSSIDMDIGNSPSWEPALQTGTGSNEDNFEHTSTHGTGGYTELDLDDDMNCSNNASGATMSRTDGGSDRDRTGDMPHNPAEPDVDVNMKNVNDDSSDEEPIDNSERQGNFMEPDADNMQNDNENLSDERMADNDRSNRRYRILSSSTTFHGSNNAMQGKSLQVRKRSRVDTGEPKTSKKPKPKSKATVDSGIIDVEESTSEQNQMRWTQIEEELFVEQPVLDLDTSVPPNPKLKMKRLVKAWGPKGETLEFEPSSHDALTMNALKSFVEKIEEGYENGKPLYLSDPNTQNTGSVKESIFKIISEADFIKLRPSDVQQILRKQHIVVTDKHHESVSFEDAVLDIGQPSTVTDIQDLSIENGPYRTRTGTLNDLLEASRSESSKILNCLGLKLPFAGIDSLPFSSDARALRSIFKQEGSFKGQIPTEHLRWCLAATKDAFHVFHIDSDGYATFIKVIAGSKWWMVARPKHGSTFEDFNVSSFLLDERFGLYKAGGDLFDMEAILLQPGSELIMRPNTPHAVFTPEHAVCHGGHFYATLTISDTFVAMVHTFVCDLFITNAVYTESRLILAAMVNFYHTGLVKNAVMAESAASHIPDPTTEGSFANLLVISTLGVLINALCHMTYSAPGTSHHRKMTVHQAKLWSQFDLNGLSDHQRKLFCLTRGFSLELIVWLDMMYDSGIPNCPIAKLFAMNLIDICKMLVNYKWNFDRTQWLCSPNITLKRLKVQLQAVLTLVRDVLDPCLLAMHELDWDVSKWELALADSAGKRMLPCIPGVKISERPTRQTFDRLSHHEVCALGETALDKKFARRPTN